MRQEMEEGSMSRYTSSESQYARFGIFSRSGIEIVGLGLDDRCGGLVG